MTTVLLTPAERLTLSRERLRQAMKRPDAQDASSAPTGNKAVGLGLLEVLKSALPSASLVIDALAQWWAGHPLQASGNLVEGVAEELLRPLAKRHPLTLVAGAMAVGALLVWSRPWRWALRPQVLNTWGPAVLSSALASSAVQGWLLGVLAKNSATQPPAQQAPAQPPTESQAQAQTPPQSPAPANVAD